MKLLVTHRAPDIDALTSVWILKRFDPEHFADAKIAFVDAGKTIDEKEVARLGFSMNEVIHTDTGNGEFDHHQADRAHQRVCAASLTYDYVSNINTSSAQDWALQQIVEYVLVDDHFEDFFFEDASSARNLFAFRGILHGEEIQGLHTDETQITFGFRCLDSIYASLKERKKAIDEVTNGEIFETKWGRSLGMETSNQAAVRFAQLQGFNLVIQKDPRRGGVNIKAAPRPELDLTQLYEKIVSVDTIGNWFFHNGLHMIINNSSHAHQKPTPLSLNAVMRLAKECV